MNNNNNINNNKPGLVLTGGGTAGHIMPCVALIEELKNDFRLYYIGSANGMERDIITKIPYVTYYPVTTVKFIRRITFKNLAIPFRLLKGVREAKKILKEINPDVIFSKGGFVALPVTMAARCPLICHESDRTVGLANKLVKKKAVHMAASFPEVAGDFKNGVFTGCPVRQSLYRPKESSARPVLLIMGGSLGAKAINDCVTAALSELVKKFDIIHLTGKGKGLSAALPKDAQSRYTQIEFENDIGRLYAKASVVLSRGGGTALFELAALKIPSLIIPLPKGASRGDQITNAEYFEKKGLCRVLPQSKLTPDALLSELDLVLNDKSLKQNLNSALDIDGTKKIAELIRKTARNTSLK